MNDATADGIGESTFDLVGPFEVYEVVCKGRKVPLLTAHPRQGGQIGLTLDNRFGIDLDLATAEQVVPFIANAIAVAMGFSCHPGTADESDFEEILLTPFPKMHSI